MLYQLRALVARLSPLAQDMVIAATQSAPTNKSFGFRPDLARCWPPVSSPNLENLPRSYRELVCWRCGDPTSRADRAQAARFDDRAGI